MKVWLWSFVTFETSKSFFHITGHIRRFFSPTSMQTIFKLFRTKRSVSWPSNQIAKCQKSDENDKICKHVFRVKHRKSLQIKYLHTENEVYITSDGISWKMCMVMVRYRDVSRGIGDTKRYVWWCCDRASGRGFLRWIIGVLVGVKGRFNKAYVVERVVVGVAGGFSRCIGML